MWRGVDNSYSSGDGTSLIKCGNFQITYYANNIKAINKLVMLIKTITLKKITTYAATLNTVTTDASRYRQGQ